MFWTCSTARKPEADPEHNCVSHLSVSQEEKEKKARHLDLHYVTG